MRKLITMREALQSSDLLGPILGGESWLGWRSLLIAAMGEGLSARERAAFQKLTGRDAEPGELADEAWFIVGRRGGKTQAMAALA
jgi:hypothetical protein